MNDKKIGYLLILILLTLFLLVFGKQFFIFQIIQFFLAVTWAIIIFIIFLFLIGKEDKPTSPRKDVLVRIKDKKLPDFELLERIEGYRFHFVGGSKKSEILHFQGEDATEKNIKGFLEKFGVKNLELL
jgi:hypothetical protein